MPKGIITPEARARCAKSKRKRIDRILANPGCESKQCGWCNRFFPITQDFFHFTGGRIASRLCRACRRIRSRLNKKRNPRSGKDAYRKWQVDNAERLAQLNRKYYARDKLDCLTFYSKGTPHCACCGESIYDFLTIDHINGGGREEAKSIRTRGIYFWLKSRDFPPGYRVLCFNCNFARGRYGYCPHERKKMLEMRKESRAHSGQLPNQILQRPLVYGVPEVREGETATAREIASLVEAIEA